MALLKKKDQTPETTPTETAVTSGVSVVDMSFILRGPRITEKGTDGIARHVYLFTVHPSANKIQVKEAIKRVYGVTPKAVRLVPVPRKSVRNARTGKKGMRAGGKKAYVYLNEGDTISIM